MSLILKKILAGELMRLFIIVSNTFQGEIYGSTIKFYSDTL